MTSLPQQQHQQQQSNLNTPFIVYDVSSYEHKSNIANGTNESAHHNGAPTYQRQLQHQQPQQKQQQHSDGNTTDDSYCNMLSKILSEIPEGEMKDLVKLDIHRMLLDAKHGRYMQD